MRSIDINSFEEICISNVTIVSGVRPAGRTIHILNAGRRYNGLLYIWDGEAHFLTQNNQSVCVKNGELLFIPKGLLYKMQYTAPSTTFVLANLDMIDKNGKDVLLSKELAVLARDDASNRIAKIMANLELCGSSQNLAALFRRKELVYKLLSAAYEIGAMSSLEDTRYPRIFAGVLLLEQSYLENKGRLKKGMKTPAPQPLHFISSDGYDIYVGKNNRQNDYVTLKIGRSTDLWFHTKDIHGSHVIIKTTDAETVPDETYLEAATLAAYYSKGRNGSNIPVDYTELKNVKKPSGAKPGMVIYVNYNTIYTNPDESTVEKLKNNKKAENNA